MPKEQKCFSLGQNKNNLLRRNENYPCMTSKSSSILYIKKNNEVKSQTRKLKDLKNVCYKLTQRIDDEDPKKVTIKSNIYSKKHKYQPKIKVTFSFQTYNPASKKEWSRRNTASDCNLSQKYIFKKQDFSFLSAKNSHMIGDTPFTNIIRQSSKDNPQKNPILKFVPSSCSSKSTEFMKCSKSCSNQYYSLQSKVNNIQLKKKNLENNKFHNKENKCKAENSTSLKRRSRPKYQLGLNTFLGESNEFHTAFFSKDFCITGKKLTFWKKIKLRLDALQPSQMKCNENHDGKPVPKYITKKNNIATTNDCDVNFCFTKNHYGRPTQDIKRHEIPTYKHSRHYTPTPASNCGEFKVIQFPHDYRRSERSNKDKTVSLKPKLCQCKKLKILSERLTRCSCESYRKYKKRSKCMDINIKDSRNPGHEKEKTSNIQFTSDTLLKRTEVEQRNNGICIKVLNVDGNLTDGKHGVTINKPCARRRNAETQKDDYNNKQKGCRIQLFKNRTTCSRRILNKMSADISTNKLSQSNAKQLIERNIGDTNQIQYSDYTYSTSPKTPRTIKSCPCNRASDKPNKLILVSPEKINYEVKMGGKCLKILNYNNVKMFKCSKHHANNSGTCKKKINEKRDRLLRSSVMMQCVQYNNNYRKLISAVLKSLVKRKKTCTRNRDIKTNQEEISFNNLYSNTHLANKRKIIDEKCKSCLKSRFVQWYKGFKHMSSSIPKEFKKVISLKRIRSKLPDFKAKEVYRMTLTRRPCFIMYNVCPWIYPHFLYFIKFSKQMFQIFLFMLAALVWFPCLLVLECSRFWLCHFC